MSSQNKSWREQYIDILEHGPEGRDLALARELIDSKHAEGLYNLNSRLEVTKVFWKNITTEGRLFSEQLKKELHKESFMFRFKAISLSVLSWAVGVATAIFLKLVSCT